MIWIYTPYIIVMLISFSNIIQAEQNATIWCTQYRQLSNRTLDKEFDISHLILHLNEDLNAVSHCY